MNQERNVPFLLPWIVVFNYHGRIAWPITIHFWETFSVSFLFLRIITLKNVIKVSGITFSLSFRKLSGGRYSDKSKVVDLISCNNMVAAVYTNDSQLFVLVIAGSCCLPSFVQNFGTGIAETKKGGFPFYFRKYYFVTIFLLELPCCHGD